MAQQRVPVIVVVYGGCCYTYAPEHAQVVIVDRDNLKCGDDLPRVPAGIGFEELAAHAGLTEGRDICFERAKDTPP